MSWTCLWWSAHGACRETWLRELTGQQPLCIFERSLQYHLWTSGGLRIKLRRFSRYENSVVLETTIHRYPFNSLFKRYFQTWWPIRSCEGHFKNQYLCFGATVFSSIGWLSREFWRTRWNMCTCPTNVSAYELVQWLYSNNLHDNFGCSSFLRFSIIPVAIGCIIALGTNVVCDTHVGFIITRNLIRTCTKNMKNVYRVT